MTGKVLTPEEQAFLKATGLEPKNLAPLVTDAPALPDEALERIRTRVRQKTGANPVVVKNQQPAFRRPRWWVTAAAALLVVGGTLVVSNSEAAMAAIQRLVQLVPGIGLKATDAQTLVLANPVEADHDAVRLTITGLISDGQRTEVRYRIEGLPAEGAAESGTDSPLPPSLHLADGRILSSLGGAASGYADGRLNGVEWFPALPDGTTTVTLSLPSVRGVAQPFKVPIAVVDAASAGLTEATAGGWTEERSGVRIGVPYWTVTDNKILLSLDAVAAGGLQVDEMGENNIPLALVDDQGRHYPLIEEESQLLNSSTEPMSATFQGPIAPDATHLRFRLPVVQLTENAQASLKIPLAELPMGQPLELKKQIQLGSQRFTVNTVTRVDEVTFQFALDLGPETDGAMLQRIAVSPTKTNWGGGYSAERNPETGQHDQITFSAAAPPTDNLEVIFSQPVVRLTGGWEIALPVNQD